MHLRARLIVPSFCLGIVVAVVVMMMIKSHRLGSMALLLLLLLLLLLEVWLVLEGRLECLGCGLWCEGVREAKAKTRLSVRV